MMFNFLKGLFDPPLDFEFYFYDVQIVRNPFSKTRKSRMADPEVCTILCKKVFFLKIDSLLQI